MGSCRSVPGFRALVNGKFPETAPVTPKRLFTLPAGSRYEILPDGSRILARLPDEAFLSAPITIVLNWQRLLTR